MSSFFVRTCDTRKKGALHRATRIKCLAQSVEHKALNLVVVGSSPTVGRVLGSRLLYNPINTPNQYTKITCKVINTPNQYTKITCKVKRQSVASY